MTNLNESQNAIANEINGIIVVDAGPGTGKTHTIVERYLNIVRSEKISPSDILMLTFTNNAATEMEERIKDRLITEGREDAVRHVQVSTFDAFCLRAVSESPDTVSNFFGLKETLTRGIRLSQNETLNREYFRNVYTGFIRKHGKHYGTIPALVGTSTNDVYKLIQKLMSHGISPNSEDDWFGRDIKALDGDMRTLLSEMLVLNANGSLVSEYKGDFIESRTIEKGVDTFPEKTIEEAVYEPRTDLKRFLNGVHYEYIRRSIRDNRLTFDLTALFAFIALYESKGLRKMMSYKYVMIDEFQDTNELQFMMSLLILKEPNLCVVGDWKQGIYGFRNASIENITDFEKRVKVLYSFLNKDAERIPFHIPEVKRLSLNINYRSSQLIVDTAFSALRCRGSEKHSANTEWLEKNVTKLTACTDMSEHTNVEKLHANSYENEILTILQRIQEYVFGNTCVIDGDRKRNAVYSDIAVLCRNGQMCRDILKKATEMGIPAHLQGDLDIMSTREGKLLLAWLRYVNNSYDTRGPVTILADSGYTLSELKEIFPNDSTKFVPDELKEQRNKLAKKRRRITELITSAFSFHRLNNDITQAITDVISSAHRSSLLTVSDIIRLIERDISAKTQYPVDALLERDAVVIQTMHKSKGLEYPIVIVGGLTMRKMPSNAGDKGIFIFDDKCGIRSKKEYAVVDGHHMIYDSWRWKMITSTRSPDYDGERRLLFVALSRAKQYITMTAGEKPSLFFEDVAGTRRDFDPSVDAISHTHTTELTERPKIGKYDRRRKRVPLHDIMGEYEESGGGKGPEYGQLVHRAAQRLANGLEPLSESPETEYIRNVLKGLSGSVILTEIDCSVPIDNIILAGRIDMLAVFDDRVEIHDYKTDMNNTNEQRYKIQLSAYALAASALNKPVKCFIDYVSRGETVEVEPLGEKEIINAAVAAGIDI